MSAPHTIDGMPLDDSTRRALDRIATKIERSIEQRNALICDAYRNGAGLREIARAVHLTHPGVRQILIRNNMMDEL